VNVYLMLIYINYTAFVQEFGRDRHMPIVISAVLLHTRVSV